MEFKEILSFADDLVFNKTGKHLNDLQRDILEETLQGHRYAKIAAEHECTRDHVNATAAKLWKLLSDTLGEDVKKSNVRSTLIRFTSNKFQDSISNVIGIGSLNVCGNIPHPNTISETPSPTHPTPYLDLDDAPPATIFYGRTVELNTLQYWILQQNCRLIAIAGLTGIGKTALIVQLVEQIKENFDYVIWRNLCYFDNPEELQQELIDIFPPQEIGAKVQLQTDKLPEGKERCVKLNLRKLIDCLRQYRCLIILDDVQLLLSSGQLAGYYKPEYKDYGKFFKNLGKVNHNSCLILNSWEVPQEAIALAEETPQVRILNLAGLGEAAKDILREKGLGDESYWDELIEKYQGHPLWLKQVATIIEELFGGKISQCFQDRSLLLPEEIKAILTQQFHRLTELEKKIIECLGSEENSLSMSQLLQKIQSSQGEVVNGVQSLIRRGLIERIKVRETCFKIAPVIREFGKLYSEYK